MPADPKAILEQLLQTLGFEVKINQREEEGVISLEVETNDPGRLIGRQGQTLSELQYITNRLIFRQDPDSPKVTLDVGNYRSQQKDALLVKAREAAEKVRKWGDIVELEPLNAYDRRIIHTALKDDPGIETYSVEVEGTDKKAMVLRPKRQ